MKITKEKAVRLREIIELAMNAANLDDGIAVEGMALFPLWTFGVNYKVGERVRFENSLYKVLENHISLETWTPDIATSFYAKY